MLAFANIRSYRSVALLVAFDVAAALIVPDAFEVNPNRNDNDIGVANDCSVETNESLKVDPGNVDQIADQNEKYNIGNFSGIGLFLDLDAQHLEKPDSSYY